MNRKRAQKIAQMKAPDIQEMAAMRKYVARVRSAELLLAVVVRQIGGEIVLAKGSLETAPNINVRRLSSGGLVLTTTPTPEMLELREKMEISNKVEAARAKARHAAPEATPETSEVPA